MKHAYYSAIYVPVFQCVKRKFSESYEAHGAGMWERGKGWPIDKSD